METRDLMLFKTLSGIQLWMSKRIGELKGEIEKINESKEVGCSFLIRFFCSWLLKFPLVNFSEKYKI